MTDCEYDKPVDCCVHVINDPSVAKIVVVDDYSVKITCEKKIHDHKDFFEVDKEFLNNTGIIEIVFDLAGRHQVELTDGEWCLGDVDRSNTLIDNIADDVIEDLLDVTRKIYLNGGMWVYRNENGLGATTLETGSAIPMWFSLPLSSDCECSKKSAIKQFSLEPEFVKFDDIIPVIVLPQIENNYGIVVNDYSSSMSIKFYPLDIIRFLLWAKTKKDPVIEYLKDNKGKDRFLEFCLLYI